MLELGGVKAIVSVLVTSTGKTYYQYIRRELGKQTDFRTHDIRTFNINEEIKVAAAEALAGLISGDELNEDYIIHAASRPRVGPAVAEAVY